MKFLRQHIYITIFSIIVWGILGCKNRANSEYSNNPKSVSINKEEETNANSIQEKSLPKESKNKNNFQLPEGYVLFDKIKGDLNGDKLDDYVLIIKGTEKENIVINRFDKKVDRNRRGILIYLTKNEKTVLTTKNLSCFSSENEDGGVYFPPQLSIEIENGKLFLNYAHGRYGYWKYTFRYQNSDFELIGYDAINSYGPIINQETSINFLTKKKLIRENINQDTEDSGDEIFEETWEDIEIGEMWKLSAIKDFDGFDTNL